MITAMENCTSTRLCGLSLHLVDKHFIESIPGKEGGRRKHPSDTCSVCNVSKEALSDAGFGDSYKPKVHLLLMSNM